MATPAKKMSNFKTYEAQSRLLAALIASHDFKIDYKKLAEHHGNSTTASAVEHRFRPLRAAAKQLQAAVRAGLDPSDVDVFGGEGKKELAAAYGESTPDGLQFQFRGIKAGAEKIKQAVHKGEDPKAAFGAAALSAPSTPSTAGGRKRKLPAASTKPVPMARSIAPRRNGPKVDYHEDTDKDESSEKDYDELDPSPTRLTKKARATPNSSLSRVHTPAGTLATETEVSTPSYHDAMTMIKQEIADDDIAFAMNGTEYMSAGPFSTGGYNSFSTQTSTVAAHTSSFAPTTTTSSFALVAATAAAKGSASHAGDSQDSLFFARPVFDREEYYDNGEI